MSFGVSEEKRQANIAKGGWGFPMLATKPHWFPPNQMGSICQRWRYGGQRSPDSARWREQACKLCITKLDKEKL